MEQDIKWMNEALVEAKVAAEKGEVPIGAVIVYMAEDPMHAKIIARAHNQVQALNDPTAHAEMIAITMATEAMNGKYLPDCSLYVTIEPCVMCAGATKWAQLKRVVYGASEPKVGYSVWAPQALHPKSVVIRGVLEDKCRDLMTDFFKQKRF